MAATTKSLGPTVTIRGRGWDGVYCWDEGMSRLTWAVIFYDVDRLWSLLFDD